MMYTLMKNLIVGLVVLGLFVGFLKVLSIGYEKELRRMCINLKQQSVVYGDKFWVSATDKETCDALNILIVARVGNPYEK